MNVGWFTSKYTYFIRNPVYTSIPIKYLKGPRSLILNLVARNLFSMISSSLQSPIKIISSTFTIRITIFFLNESFTNSCYLLDIFLYPCKVIALENLSNQTRGDFFNLHNAFFSLHTIRLLEYLVLEVLLCILLPQDHHSTMCS